MSNTRSTTAPKGRATPARQSKPPAPTFKLMGAEYRLADKVGIWPLMQYCRAYESGADSEIGQRRLMASAHAILEDSLHPEDWPRFQEDMIVKKMDDILMVLDAVMGAIRAAEAKRGRNGRRPQAVASVEELT